MGETKWFWQDTVRCCSNERRFDPENYKNVLRYCKVRDSNSEYLDNLDVNAVHIIMIMVLIYCVNAKEFSKL